MDKDEIKEKIKLTKQLIEKNETIIKKNEKIERLEKEKEWLEWEVIGDDRYGLFTSGEKEKEKLRKRMQQALKEERDEKDKRENKIMDMGIMS